MKIGDIVRSNKTGREYIVISKPRNKQGFVCREINPENTSYYFFDEEVTVVSETSISDLNRCAVENIKNHIILKLEEMKKAEEQAIKEERIQSQIDMYHDSFCLLAGFLAQLY